jgi:hypothetical protein
MDGVGGWEVLIRMESRKTEEWGDGKRHALIQPTAQVHRTNSRRPTAVLVVSRQALPRGILSSSITHTDGRWVSRARLGRGSQYRANPLGGGGGAVGLCWVTTAPPQPGAADFAVH